MRNGRRNRPSRCGPLDAQLFFRKIDSSPRLCGIGKVAFGQSGCGVDAAISSALISSGRAYCSVRQLWCWESQWMEVRMQSITLRSRCRKAATLVITAVAAVSITGCYYLSASQSGAGSVLARRTRLPAERSSRPRHFRVLQLLRSGPGKRPSHCEGRPLRVNQREKCSSDSGVSAQSPWPGSTCYRKS